MLPALILAMFVGDARAADPNRSPTVHVLFVYAVRQEHPFGMRVGVDWQFALGDHCEYAEFPDCRVSVDWASLWPIVAPAASVTWRGGDRFGFELGGEVGVASLDMAHSGFGLLAELIGRVGARLETPGPTGGVALGGFLAKSFSPRLYVTGDPYEQVGTDSLGLRFDVETLVPFDGAPRPPTVGIGSWMATAPRMSAL